MTKAIDKNTEKRILEAAKEIFLKKGFDGARMQEIADTAGINKAMLHYYFRSKDRLFESIFNMAIANLFPKVSSILLSELDFEVKLRSFISEYIDFILKNPFLPNFIIHEMSSNPGRFIEHLAAIEIRPKLRLLQSQLNDKISSGEYRNITIDQLIINVISMVIFPVAASPIIKHLLNKTDDEYSDMLSERKDIVTDFVLSSLRV